MSSTNKKHWSKQVASILYLLGKDFFQLLHLNGCGTFLLKVKLIGYFGLYKSSLHFSRRENQIIMFMGSKFSFPFVDIYCKNSSLKCWLCFHLLLWLSKNNLRFLFCSSFKYYKKFTTKRRCWSLFLIKFYTSYFQPPAFIKKETPAQNFSCEFCKNFKNTFFIEQVRVTAVRIFNLLYNFHKLRYFLNILPKSMNLVSLNNC